MDLKLFQGRGIAIDLRRIQTKAILPEHLEPSADKIKKDDIILLYTGWAQKRNMSKEYLYEWPYVTKEAAEWLVEKGIKCICIDGLSVGGWPEGTGAPPHLVFLKAEVVIIEELYMDDTLFEEEEWYISAFPLKLKGFGGSPVRVIAMAFE
jgi:kynurenine formamidase